MAATMLQLTFCVVLLTGALGLPLSSEEKANQFLGLKKQTPLSDYLQLSGNQSNVGEKLPHYKEVVSFSGCSVFWKFFFLTFHQALFSELLAL